MNSTLKRVSAFSLWGLLPTLLQAQTVTGSGTSNFIPRWTGRVTQGNSLLFQNGSAVEFPAMGTATVSKGFNSDALDLIASAFKKGGAAGNQLFRFQAEPVGNNTSSPAAKLNLLFASGSSTPTETGLSINSKGQILFAPGQTFPTVSGNEKVTGSVSANQMISTVATGTPPLQVSSTTLVPNLNASLLGGQPASAFATLKSNSFSGFQTIAGNGLSMYIGDVACPLGTVGIQAIVFSFGCQNYALLLDTQGNTIINSPPKGTISFRQGNVEAMALAGGELTTSARIFSREVEGSDPASGATGILALSDGVFGQGAHGGAGLPTGAAGVEARGGDFGSTAQGGFGIEAQGGINSDGTLQRAGEFHGDVEIQGCLGVSGGNPIGTCQSDLRLKKNIEAFPAVLDKVAQLRPVSYEWQREKYPQRGFNSGRNSGLIAQEVEKVFPELVSADAAGFKRVNYGELPFLMLQAIRELKAQNDALRRELREVDATRTREIADLRSQFRRPQLDPLLP